MKDFLFTDLISFVGEAPKKFDGYKKYVSTGAVNGNIIESDDIELVDYSSRPSRANLVACSGDILFAKMAETEKTLLLDDETEKNIYSTGFCAIRAKENIIEPKALYYLLGSSLFLNQKNTNSSGATQRAITNTGLSKIRIKLPTMEKQREFCGIMDKVVDSIELRKKQLGYFDKFTKSLFIEMFGDPVENPKKWNISTLLTLGSCKNGMNFHIDDFGVEINCIGVGDFKDYDVISNTHSLPIVSLNSMPTEDYLLKDEDIVFVRSNGNKTMVGRSIVIYPGKNLVTFSGFCIRYRNEDSSIMVPYLLRVVKTESIRMQMYGRGANIQNLNQKILASLKIPIPPMNLQEKFVQSISSIDKSKYSSFSHLSA